MSVCKANICVWFCLRIDCSDARDIYGKVKPFAHIICTSYWVRSCGPVWQSAVQQGVVPS